MPGSAQRKLKENVSQDNVPFSTLFDIIHGYQRFFDNFSSEICAAFLRKPSLTKEIAKSFEIKADENVLTTVMSQKALTL